MNFLARVGILLLAAFSSVSADIYFHNPRGSNNRWNENRRGRNNAKRLFDSQNNDRGGYNVGSLYYYVGSILRLEWTNQHSCGNENNHCDVTIQYMCGDTVRDGTTTSTIPSNPIQCKDLDCNEDRQYGMHEDFYHYQGCRLRQRNYGLYTANRNLRAYASSTRQNQNANRYGYECPEEKDYFPNWHPSPWKDIAVLTNDVSRCGIYTSESQNVKDKYACVVDPTFLYQYSNKEPPNKKYIPITEEECHDFVYTVNGVTKNGTWTRFPAHGVAAPRCVQSQYSRDNHLGNSPGGQTHNYNWTIPNDVNEKCVLRIRYNITTGDYDRDNTTYLQNNRRRRDGPGPDIWTKFGFTESVGNERGYYLKNDPIVDIFNIAAFKLRLAVDTQQYGRTFQDRTHTFAIRPRPPSISDDTEILNINVRGKRGNIVQVYPGVEYDFVPNTQVSPANSYVHFQWTGSDNNPGNNAGQGRASTDRSNVVMLRPPVYAEGRPKTNTYGQLGNSYPSHLANASLGGLGYDDLLALSILRDHLGGDMDTLDDAGTYFDLQARKVTMAGTYNYMCTRNNNFSNRSQKGRLIVVDATFANDYIDMQGGTLTVPTARSRASTEMVVPPAALVQAQNMELWEIPHDKAAMTTSPHNKDYISQVVKITPEGKITTDDKPITVTISYSTSLPSLYIPEVFFLDGSKTWVKVPKDTHTGSDVTFKTHYGGHYVVSKAVDSGPMAGLVIGLLVGLLVIIVLAVIIAKNRHLLSSYKSKV